MARSFRTGLGQVSDLDADVLSGRALLWIVYNNEIECAGVTRIEDAGGRVCVILAFAGRGRSWLPLISEIEQYAKNEDCRIVRWIGRKGWKRLLPQYRETAIVMERKING